MKEEILTQQLSQGRLTDSGEFPKVVLIDTVSFCNLKCSMCVHKDMTRKKGIMSWDLFTKIIDEIAKNNKDTRIWMVFFGDPFVIKNKKPSIFDMIKYAKNKGLTDVVLNSNGVLMDKKASQNLIESGIDAIYFGIDAFTAPVYEQLRVDDDYQKTVDNVVYLLNLRRSMKSKKTSYCSSICRNGYQ